MALVLSVRGGDDFFIGDRQFVVTTITAHHVHFGIMDCLTGKEYVITDARSEEVLDDVFLAAGKRQQMSFARAIIAAPDDVLILRGDNYRAGLLEERV